MEHKFMAKVIKLYENAPEPNNSETVLDYLMNEYLIAKENKDWHLASLIQDEIIEELQLYIDFLKNNS